MAPTTKTKVTKKPNPMQSKTGYSIIIVPKSSNPKAHAERSLELRAALIRNGHNFTNLVGRTKDGSEKRMMAVAFDPATKEKIDKIPVKHRKGVIHVKSGVATHAADGRRLGKLTKVSETDAKKEHSMRDAAGNHYVIR